MKRVRRIRERPGTVAARLCNVGVRMEDDLRAALRGPAHGFRVAPPFVADRDAEGQRTALEETSPVAARVGDLL
jgi:hypothetical protein